MKNNKIVHFTGKPYLIAGMMMFILVLSACGSPSAVSTPEGEPVEVAATESPASVSTLDESSQSNTPTSEVQALPAASLSYSKDVYPIFEATCIKCHGVEKVSRGLDLTSYDKTMSGSVKGPVIVPGDSVNSTLVKLIADGKMPKQGTKLTPEQVELVRNWVSQGAPNN